MVRRVKDLTLGASIGNVTFVKAMYVGLALVLMALVLSDLLRWWVFRWWLALPVLPALLMGFHLRDRLGRTAWFAWFGLAVSLILVFGGKIVLTMVANVVDPPEWDFQLFWLFGRATVLGLSPYDHESLLRLAGSLQPSAAFLKELYFFHSPPTLFLFAPLGWFDLREAYLTWYVLLSVSFILDVILLRRLFLPATGPAGLLLAAALSLMLRSTVTSFLFGQTNVIVLLLLLLFWSQYARARSGAWLAFAVLIKPLPVFFLAHLALLGRWRTLALTFGVSALACLAAVGVFGLKMVLPYFVSNPILSSMPPGLYSEDMNQSLFATILRTARQGVDGASPTVYAVFLIAALLQLGVTAWLLSRIGSRCPDLALALTMGVALLVFPKTLEHYGLFLLPSFFLLWRYRGAQLGATSLLCVVIAVAYALNGRGFVFACILLTWLLLVSLAIRESQRLTMTKAPGLSRVRSI